jgi:hypothetical protein
MDAVKAAPMLYKVLHDTLGIRKPDVTYNPGDSSVMHSHPDLTASKNVKIILWINISSLKAQ